MKLGFLELPPGERRLYMEQAALRRNVSPRDHGEGLLGVLVARHSVRVRVRGQPGIQGGHVAVEGFRGDRAVLRRHRLVAVAGIRPDFLVPKNRVSASEQDDE